MRATDWEFEYRAAIIGGLFAVAFALAPLDRRNAAVALGSVLASRIGGGADRLTRAIFAVGALAAALAAFLRTWASAYLSSDVVYADSVKTASLVADGPYRFVRNPLYLANVVLAAGFGVMASRLGFVVLNVFMLMFSLRLIRREEDELESAQGAGYAVYRARVPRLLPSPTPRVPASGRRAQWADGFKSESWYWGFAMAVAVFAVTLSVPAFFVIMAASIATLFFTSRD